MGRSHKRIIVAGIIGLIGSKVGKISEVEMKEGAHGGADNFGIENVYCRLD